MIEGRKIIILPTISADKTQGELILRFLEILDDFGGLTRITEVRQKLKPHVVEKKEHRIETVIDQVQNFCQTLDLISTQEGKMLLTFFGWKIISNAHKKNSKNIFDKENLDTLGKIVLFLDANNWKISQVLEDAKSGLTPDELCKKLREQRIAPFDEKIKRSEFNLKFRKYPIIRNKEFKTYEEKQKFLERFVTNALQKSEKKVISKLLNLLYCHVGLVKKDKGKFIMNEIRKKELLGLKIWRKSEEVDANNFVETIKKAYLDAVKLEKGEKTVPIIIVKTLVCKYLNMPFLAFDKLLTAVNFNKFDFDFAFDKARFTKPWSSKIKDSTFYYIRLISK